MELYTHVVIQFTLHVILGTTQNNIFLLTTILSNVDIIDVNTALNNLTYRKILNHSYIQVAYNAHYNIN